MQKEKVHLARRREEARDHSGPAVFFVVRDTCTLVSVSRCVPRVKEEAAFVQEKALNNGSGQLGLRNTLIVLKFLRDIFC